MNISPEFVYKQWLNQATYRQGLTKRFKYYHGEHSVLRTDSLTIRGQIKNSTPVNFIDYILDTHTALNTSSPYQFVQKEESQDPTPFDNLDEVKDRNSLHTVDSQHFLNALIFGYSIEVYSFEDQEIRVRKYDPREWCLIKDNTGVIHLAIHVGVAKANTVYQGQFIDKDLTIYTAYDSAMIRTYIGNSEGKIISSGEEVPHPYGRVPIVIFQVNESMSPFLSDQMIEQNNVISRIVNARLDEVEYVNSILAAIGFAANDETKKAMGQAAKEGAVVLPPDSDLRWITKSNETEKYRDSIADAREFIFMQGKLPDRKDVQGALSSLSGEAIKFLYQPTLQQAEFFQRFIQKGLRYRIKLFNIIWGILGQPLLEDYDINVNVSLPVDTKSIAEAAKTLEGIVSHRRQLEMLPGVDVEKELRRIEEQSQTTTAPPPPDTPAATQAVQKEATISKATGQFKTRLETLMAERPKV